MNGRFARPRRQANCSAQASAPAGACLPLRRQCVLELVEEVTCRIRGPAGAPAGEGVRDEREHTQRTSALRDAPAAATELTVVQAQRRLAS